MPPGGSSGSPVAPASLTDTHVHFYDCFELAPFLEAASRNLDRAERELGLGGPAGRPARVLLVMETGGRPLIARLEEARDALGELGWRIAPTAEAGSLAIHSASAEPLTVVEGRQVVTAEDLEVLAAPCASDLPSGLELDRTLEAARGLGAVPILPWGFGKWLGRRGRIVARLLDSPSTGRVLLADNGGRLGLGSKPRLLTLGAQRGFPVVRGSDPLPIASDGGRVGSSGSLLRGAFERARPAASVRRLLSALGEPPRSFGRGVGPLVFVANQIRMQMRRRRR